MARKWQGSLPPTGLYMRRAQTSYSSLGAVDVRAKCSACLFPGAAVPAGFTVSIFQPDSLIELFTIDSGSAFRSAMRPKRTISWASGAATAATFFHTVRSWSAYAAGRRRLKYDFGEGGDEMLGVVSASGIARWCLIDHVVARLASWGVGEARC